MQHSVNVTEMFLMSKSSVMNFDLQIFTYLYENVGFIL